MPAPLPPPPAPAPPAPPASARGAWSRAGERAVIAGFWALLGALTVIRRVLDPRGPGTVTGPGVALVLCEYVLWALVTPGIFALAGRFPLEREWLGRRLALHLGVAVAVASVFEVLKRGLFFPLLFPDGYPGAPTPPITPGSALLHLHFLDELVICLAVLAAGFARDSFLRLRERQVEAARLQAEAANLTAQLSEARLSALRMQLNPHFLFNTLHAVSALVERDPGGVRRILARLSGLLRHVLDAGPRQEIPLREELAFLSDYLDIQRVRFQGRLDVTERVPPELLDALVPNLLLQPLVENAIEHGVGRLEGTGCIELEAWCEPIGGPPQRLVLAVRDNGPGLATHDGRGGGVGLANTRARLDALYGTAADLTLRPAPGGGVVAEVEFPYHTADDLRAAAVDGV